jgi:hypothetical protein
MAAVNPQVLPLSTARARQAVRMEQFDEFGVADVLVQIVAQGEVHGQYLRATRGIPVEDTTARSDRQEAEHRIPLMSQGSYLSGQANSGFKRKLDDLWGREQAIDDRRLVAGGSLEIGPSTGPVEDSCGRR